MATIFPGKYSRLGRAQLPDSRTTYAKARPMSNGPSDAGTREQRLNEAIAAYFQAAEAGQAMDSADFLARHPDLAGELAAFLDDKDRFDRLAGPVPPVAAARTVEPSSSSQAPTLPPADPAADASTF